MTREEFEALQLDMLQSGKTVKSYLQEAGMGYSTYNYWRMPYQAKATHEQLVQLLPHKWKVQHPESVMTKTS